MNITFIYSTEDSQSLNKPLNSFEYIQFGISYISAYLKRHGHDVSLLVLSSNHSIKKNIPLIKDMLADKNPQLICFTAVTTQFPFIKEASAQIKKLAPSIFQVVGGAHASVSAKEAIEASFDAVCVGEGEGPLLELAECIQKNETITGIKNLWIKKEDGAIEKNPTRPYIHDLDSLPFPDREMWVPWIDEQSDSRISILLGRGCPYLCTYCSNHAVKNISEGKYVRMRSPENIIEELNYLTSIFPHKHYYYLEVETLTAYKDWLFDLCEKLAEFNNGRTRPIYFGSNYRVAKNSLEDSIFAAFKKANFDSINIGLESGNEYIRKKILKRYYTNEQFLTAVSLAKKYDINVNLFNLVGLPEETDEMHLETVALNRMAQPNVLYTSIFFPYPGTELYDLCQRKGYLPNKISMSRERRSSVLKMPLFSQSKIKRAHTLFEYKVYRGHKPLIPLIMKIIYLKLISFKLLFTVLQVIKKAFPIKN
jgi:anaerobic magnesium-protoporphyrin IX monomethyl ester cyclase